MIIDLSEVMKDYGGRVQISGDVFMEDVAFLGETFSFDAPLHIEGSITNNTKSLELKAKVEGHAGVQCARCRKPLTVPVKFSVREILARDDGTVSHDDDVVLFSGYELDLKDIVINSFLMNVSAKYLCGEDCKGLCLKCGADLNEGECGCQREDIDPRWAALAEIMKKTSDTE